MSDKIYVCKHCDAKATGRIWNMATRNAFNPFGRNQDTVVRIQEIKVREQKLHLYYICPSCFKPCYVDQGDIGVIEID